MYWLLGYWCWKIIHLHVHVFPTFYLFYTYCDLHVYQLRLHNYQSCHFANTANPWLFFSWASWQLFTFPKEKRIYIAMFSFSLTYMQTVWIHVYPSSKHLENQNSYIHCMLLQVQVKYYKYRYLIPSTYKWTQQSQLSHCTHWFDHSFCFGLLHPHDWQMPLCCLFMPV